MNTIPNLRGKSVLDISDDQIEMFLDAVTTKNNTWGQVSKKPQTKQ